MVNKELVNRLLSSLEQVLPVSQISDEVKENIKQAMTGILQDMDIVTREEFEAQQKVLEKTRLKIEAMEQKLKELS